MNPHPAFGRAADSSSSSTACLPAEAAVTHHRVLVGGMRHHYLEAGSGEPVVLLHGFPETSHAWRKVIPALVGRYHVIAPDLRGCGDTDRPSAGYDKQTVAADLHALAGHLDLGRSTGSPRP